MEFAEKILGWYRENGRDLPWRQTTDAYKIWLSEIILQQTRVEQGTPYYFAFTTHLPTVEHFAAAEEEEILRLWQGLGYYSRARNMHKAAKMVMGDFGGDFPTSYQDLIKLPGVGDYTAAAISSFVANEPQAVLDGNVFRVLSRVYEIDLPINSTEGKKVFKELAQGLIPVKYAGEYNHAIMDFGAIQCKPKIPFCLHCTFQQDCLALNRGRVAELPVKLKGKASRNRFFHYFVFEKEGSVLMSKRGDGDVWANLYEFPMIETAHPLDLPDVYEMREVKKHFVGATIEPIGALQKHILSHQNIFAQFYKVSNLEEVREKKEFWKYCLSEKIDKLAKHKLIFSFLDRYLQS